MDREGVLSQ